MNSNPRPAGRVTRRGVLLAASALPILAACSAVSTSRPGQAGPSPTGPSPTGPAATASRPADAERALGELEKGFGRLGVYALDTGSGVEIRHRADQRFPLCSTFKVLAVAALLRADTQSPGLLTRRIHYTQADLVDSSPVTPQHVVDGMTVSQLCAAAIIHSDNSAAVLLLDLIGGPAGLTSFARSLGDPLTTLTRTETALNDVPPGTTADTTTPTAMGANLRALLLGDALAPTARTMLTDLMVRCTTGTTRIRAGLPNSWRVGDKTGSGFRGEINDIAVAWPPQRAPVIISMYAVPTDPKVTRPEILAAAAKTVATAFAPGH